LSFKVEFRKDDQYRYYEYHCPDVWAEESEDCRKMQGILATIDKEIGLGMWHFRCKD